MDYSPTIFLWVGFFSYPRDSENTMTIQKIEVN